MSKILVTGGAGFVGSNLSDRLIEDGHEVIVLDDLSKGTRENIRHLLDKKNFKLIEADITDKQIYLKLPRDIDVIIHLAAIINVDESYYNPERTYEVNVIGTQNLLNFARDYNIKKFVYASSSEVYGSCVDNKPMSEEHPLNPPHNYGVSKLAADRMCFAYRISYHMDVRVVRSFNLYGPKQSKEIYGGVIAKFSDKILSGRSPVIFGNGNQTRDYLYVKDIVDAYILVMNYEGELNEPLNFGTGKDYSIKFIAEKLIDLYGKKDTVKIEYVSARIGEVHQLVADFSKAKKLLGWTPKYDIEKGLNEYTKWFKMYD